MLECTWSDTEAEIALRRMQIKEQAQRKFLASKQNIKKEPAESTVASQSLKQAAAAAGGR